MKPTKTIVKKLIPALEGDYETVEEAAEAVLVKAWELYEGYAKFVVAGQLRYGRDGWVDPGDARASKVAVGPFATESQARLAVASLAFSQQTGEQFKCWTVPLWTGTPAKYYTDRALQRKADDLADASYFEHELARRREWFAEHPKVLTLPEDMQGEIPFRKEAS